MPATHRPRVFIRGHLSAAKTLLLVQKRKKKKSSITIEAPGSRVIRTGKTSVSSPRNVGGSLFTVEIRVYLGQILQADIPYI